MNAIRNDLDLDVRPVAGRIGAEVLGVRLSGGSSPPPSRRSARHCSGTR